MSVLAELRLRAEQKASTAEAISAVLVGILNAASQDLVKETRHYIGRRTRGSNRIETEYDTEYAHVLNEYVRNRRLSTIYTRRANNEYDIGQGMHLSWRENASKGEEYYELAKVCKLKAKDLRKQAKERIQAEMELV